MIKNFILLGHHRSGTSYLLDLLRHSNKIDTINEPFSMHLDFFRESEEEWGGDEYLQDILHNKLLDYPETVKFIQELKVWMNIDFPNVKGIKETALFEKYYWLKNVMNIDRTIILVRDPRAVVNSILKRNMQNSWWNYEYRLKKYYSKHKGNIDLSSPLLVCIYIWKYRMKYLVEILKNNEDVLLVRLEDLVNSPIETLSKIMCTLDLEIDDAQLEFLKETKMETRNSTYSNFRKKEDVINDWEKNFSESERNVIETILDEELRFFNYK